MRGIFAAILAAVLAAASTASAEDVHPRASVRGWFFSASGDVEGQDVERFGFDSVDVQPEFIVGLDTWRHHFEAKLLYVDRRERETVQTAGDPFGFSIIEQSLVMDVEARDFRFRYGYDLLDWDALKLQPFIGLGYITSETFVVDETSGFTSENDESAVFPFPGLEITLVPALPFDIRAQALGITDGNQSLIDVEGGLRGGIGFVFGGVGYRYMNVKLVDGNDTIADVDLSGAYIEGGVRF